MRKEKILRKKNSFYTFNLFRIIFFFEFVKGNFATLFILLDKNILTRFIQIIES